MIETALRAEGCEPHLVQRTPDYVTAINLVAAGFGLAITPKVLTGLRDEVVAYRPFDAPGLSSRLLVVRNRDSDNPVVGHLFAMVEQAGVEELHSKLSLQDQDCGL